MPDKTSSFRILAFSLGPYEAHFDNSCSSKPNIEGSNWKVFNLSSDDVGSICQTVVLPIGDTSSNPTCPQTIKVSLPGYTKAAALAYSGASSFE